jgi:hypothetical protein
MLCAMMRNKIRGLLLLVVVLIAVCFITGSRTVSGLTDFAAYWTASRQLVAHQNPYAQGAVLEMERRLGFREPLPLIMRNPPWAAPFVLPLGLFQYSTAQRAWLVVQLAMVGLSVQVLWRMYAKQKRPVWVPWLVTATFVPLAAVLALGQIGPLTLLGISLFLFAQERGWDGLAGASALLVALKPHVVFLFWPAMLIWSVRNRRWRLLLGFGASVFIASAVAIFFDPLIFTHYQELWRDTAIVWSETPTLGGVLCRMLPGQNWIVWLPAIVAVIWFLLRWMREGGEWSWRGEMPRLLLVSVAASPYAWFFDQVVLLAALLPIAAMLGYRSARSVVWPAVTYLAINAAAIALILEQRRTFWYVWTAPAWLLFYVWVTLKLRVAPAGD